MVVIYRTALYNFALAGWLHESQKPLKKRHVFVRFNRIDFECQSHVNWTSMSITLEANVIDIVFQGGCARASAVFFYPNHMSTNLARCSTPSRAIL